MQAFQRGQLQARLAQNADDLARVLELRRIAFGRPEGKSDRDALDAICGHVMVEGPDRALLAAFRVLTLISGAQLTRSYTARFYDLRPLALDPRAMVEIGRFCARPGLRDPDVLRLAWAALTRIVDAAGAGVMLGCTSFPGADWQKHRAGLALLAAEFVGPAEYQPQRKSGEVVDYPALAGAVPDRRAALAGLPPLLRTYLGMGGWVSDHAVVDRDLDTLHVFTCVEVDRVPCARATALRAVAG